MENVDTPILSVSIHLFPWGMLYIGKKDKYLCAPLYLKWVSYRQHDGFFIHSSTLYLLTGEFGPFTFKVTTNRYVFIDFVSFLDVL